MMSVKVTYFSDLDVRSAKRVMDMIGTDVSLLVNIVAKSMQDDEGYACFTTPSGQVIALDKQAKFVMV